MMPSLVVDADVDIERLASVVEGAGVAGIVERAVNWGDRSGCVVHPVAGEDFALATSGEKMCVSALDHPESTIYFTNPDRLRAALARCFAEREAGEMVRYGVEARTFDFLTRTVFSLGGMTVEDSAGLLVTYFSGVQRSFVAVYAPTTSDLLLALTDDSHDTVPDGLAGAVRDYYERTMDAAGW